MGNWGFGRIANPAAKPRNGRWVSAARARAYAQAERGRAELAAQRKAARRRRRAS